MIQKECFKNASLDTREGSRTLLLTPQAWPQQNKAKVVESLKLVPRAGVEPARPMLSNPRILSPEHYVDFLKYTNGRTLLRNFDASILLHSLRVIAPDCDQILENQTSRKTQKTMRGTAWKNTLLTNLQSFWTRHF